MRTVNFYSFVIPRVVFMKKYFLSIPIILFPYTLLGALHCLYTGFLMESLFGNNGFLLLGAVVLCAAIAFLFSLLLGALAVAKKWNAKGMALCNMIIKLCQIPAYIAIFVLGVVFGISVLGLPFVAVFFLCDVAAIVTSGLVGASAAYVGFLEGKLLKSDAIIYALCQFIFCIDIIFCILLYVRIRKLPRVSADAYLTPDLSDKFSSS